jgi:hypothetical protein
MAQTKKKRSTKHRGNAAGVVEARGRTSRPASPEVRKAQAKEQVRSERLRKPPTWKSSFRRAALLLPFMFVALILLNHRSGSVPAAAIFSVFAFALYVPGGYYIEQFLWKRRNSTPTTGNKRGK